MKLSFGPSLVLGCLFLSGICWAEEKVSLIYRLGPATRLEVQVTTDGSDHEGAKKTIQILLHDSKLPQPLSLTGSLVAQGEGGITTWETLTFPPADQIRGALPKGVSLESEGSFRRNLREEGIFLFRSQKSAKSYLEAYPIPAILKKVWPLGYRFAEPPRSPEHPIRLISLKQVEDTAGAKSQNLNNLLVSIADTDGKGGLRSLGTIVTDLYGAFYRLDSEWHDFALQGGEWNYALHESGYLTHQLQFNGKAAFELISPMGVDPDSWPDPKVNQGFSLRPDLRVGEGTPLEERLKSMKSLEPVQLKIVSEAGQPPAPAEISSLEFLKGSEPHFAPHFVKEMLPAFERGLEVRENQVDLETAKTFVLLKQRSEGMIPALLRIGREKSKDVIHDGAELNRALRATQLLAEYAELDPRALDALDQLAKDGGNTKARHLARLKGKVLRSELLAPDALGMLQDCLRKFRSL